MAYRVHLDEPVAEAVHRIALEELDGAAAALAGVDDDTADAVHEVRKHTKKLRGLVRLVRPSLGDAYAPANAAARDAARALSDVRDARALLGTFDDLVVAAGPDGLPEGGVVDVRRALAAAARDAEEHLRVDRSRLATAADHLDGLRHQVERWAPGTGFAAVGDGVHRTYRRARRALRRAEGEPTPERFHELRKRVKYHWYHLRLLREVAPSVLGPAASSAHDLSDALGDAHDLAVLAEALRGHPDRHGGPAARRALSLTDRWRGELERRSLGVGARLLAESPSGLVDRLEGLWAAARRYGPEPAAGELADLTDPVDDLGARSLAELRDAATTAGVTGRWSMDRAELVASVRAAG